MSSSAQPSSLASGPLLRRQSSLLMAVLALLAVAVPWAHAQTYSVIHNFSYETSAGWAPTAGLTLDAAGNLYGTTFYGGHASTQYCDQSGCGTVFKLSRKNGAWLLTTLYSFNGGPDGSHPAARVIFGPDGALYGTTEGSNDTCVEQSDCGTVFRLQPPANRCGSISCPWLKTMVYRFTGGADGSLPGYGDLVFDRGRNIYGTTEAGGPNYGGTVFRLTPQAGGWRESVLYGFGGLDGVMPVGGVSFDLSGNLYGTTAFGGSGYFPPEYYGAGVVFEMTPTQFGWAESTLYNFVDYSDGALPYTTLTVDPAGNLYGTAGAGGSSYCYQQSEQYGGCGTVFVYLDGPQPIYFFQGNYAFGAPPGPQAPLTFDAAGNLYGTYYGGGVSAPGGVFQLAAGSHAYVSLHEFNGDDGEGPVSNVIMDSSGTLYGTASQGGSGYGGGGVVWEITP